MKKFLSALIILAFSSTMAFAVLTLDAAKQSGLVGEKPDGTIGAVAAPTPDISALVETTNSERLEKYKAIAAKNGTDLAKVQALAGQKLIDQTPAGQYVMSGGGWAKK
jgi:uncharacterized protein YdbL (DUF1318 family)